MHTCTHMRGENGLDRGLRPGMHGRDPAERHLHGRRDGDRDAGPAGILEGLTQRGGLTLIAHAYLRALSFSRLMSHPCRDSQPLISTTPQRSPKGPANGPSAVDDDHGGRPPGRER